MSAPTEDTPRTGGTERCGNFDACGKTVEGGPGTGLCAACRSVAYCSRACQAAHWAVHKVACKDHVKRDKAQQWLQELGNPYAAVAFDHEDRTAIEWGVYGAPETFLVDGHGRIVYKFISPMPLDVWQREFLPRIEAARRSGA